MRAAVCTKYGPPEVVVIQERPKPTPKADELLIRVHATTVESGDARVRAADFPGGFAFIGRIAMGFGRPRKRVLGTSLAGEVEAVGAKVMRFQVGEKVVASTGGSLGAHAEYVCFRETGAVAKKPSKMGYDEAAALPFGGQTALYFLRDLAKVQRGQDVLVYGASGSVGIAAVQVARHLGAQVTGVCSGANVSLVKSLGAGRVIDYTRQDFTKDGGPYDVLFDTVGKTSFAQCKALLKPDGRYLPAVATVGQFVRGAVRARHGKRLLTGVAPDRCESVEAVIQLAEAGTLRPVIDRRYPLEQIVAAHQYVDTGHKRGTVVISVRP